MFNWFAVKSTLENLDICTNSHVMNSCFSYKNHLYSIWPATFLAINIKVKWITKLLIRFCRYRFWRMDLRWFYPPRGRSRNSLLKLIADCHPPLPRRPLK